MSALGDRLEGAKVLDLYAGSGALGLEALSRGAREVVFVEKSPSALRILRANVEILEAGDKTRIVAGDAQRFVRGLGPEEYDIALADPPYGLGIAESLFRMYRAVPFARELWVEHRSSERLPQLPGHRCRRYGDTSLTSTSVIDD
jgi:16S rRNA (guanine966-N2)-methyltransferase